MIAPLTASPFVYGAQYLVNQLTLNTFELLPVGGGTALSTTPNQTYSGKNRLRLALVSNLAGTKNFQAQVERAREILNIPQIFVDFHSKGNNSTDMIDTIDGVARGSKFILYTNQSLIQRDEYEKPIWIHYICDMPQTLDFKKNDAVIIKLQDRNGTIIDVYSNLSNPDNSLSQLLMTLSLKW